MKCKRLKLSNCKSVIRFFWKNIYLLPVALLIGKKMKISYNEKWTKGTHAFLYSNIFWFYLCWIYNIFIVIPLKRLSALKNHDCGWSGTYFLSNYDFMYWLHFYAHFESLVKIMWYLDRLQCEHAKFFGTIFQFG